MTLYLLRHAEAEDRAPTDAARQLTPHGLDQARHVAAFCLRHDLRPDLILTSPFRRTIQTAELVAAVFGQTPQPAPFLASGMHPADALDELRAYDRFDSVLLVGHQPDLGLLIAALLGLESDDNLAVGKAALTGLEVNQLSPGGGTLRFFLPAHLAT